MRTVPGSCAADVRHHAAEVVVVGECRRGHRTVVELCSSCASAYLKSHVDGAACRSCPRYAPAGLTFSVLSVRLPDAAAARRAPLGRTRPAASRVAGRTRPV